MNSRRGVMRSPYCPFSVSYRNLLFDGEDYFKGESL